MSAMSPDTISPATNESSMDLHPIIAGYRIGNEMGRGPLGKIYRAERVSTGERVVFRGFTRPEGANPEKWKAAKNQFRDLLEKHRRVDKHPVIQDIIDFGEDNTGLFWIATEYFEGRTLQQIITDEGPQVLPWCLEVMIQVADAVDFAGDRGLVHTDLTPYNILLVNHPEEPDLIDVRVINFGLAHARSKFGSRYAAPEQQDGADGDRRSDVYSVGALLLELLTGQPIYTGTTAEEIAQKVKTENPMSVLAERPAYIQNVIGAMLTKAPRFRYPTVKEAVYDLVNKRSHGDADQYDGSEILTDEQTEDPNQEGGQEAVPQETSGKNRFHNLDIGDDVPAPTTSKAASGRDPGRIALQDYRLAEMDVLEIRKKSDQASKVAAQREWFRGGWKSLIAWGSPVAVIALLFVHAASRPAVYSEMRAVAVKGSVTGRPAAPSGKQTAPPAPLFDGETISASDLPFLVSTGSSGSVTFSLANDEALYIPANTSVEIRQLGYEGGPIRLFRLRGGRLAIHSAWALSGTEKFDVKTIDGVSTQVEGGARFSLSDGPNKGARYAVIVTRKGSVTLGFGSATAKVTDGNMVTIRIPGTPTPPFDITSAIEKTLNAEDSALAAAPVMPTALRLTYAVEENTLMPIVALVKSALPDTAKNGGNTKEHAPAK